MTTSTTAPAGAPPATDVPIPDPMPGDAAHAPTIRTLRRLLPYARPALPALIGSAITATVAMMCGLAFPLVIQWVIDGPIAQQDLSALWPLAALLLALGVVEAGLFWVRRMLSARPTMAVEASMRAAIYDHLQKLPVAFHDRWPAGQLMSRAVADLTTIRRFLAWFEQQEGRHLRAFSVFVRAC